MEAEKTVTLTRAEAEAMFKQVFQRGSSIKATLDKYFGPKDKPCQ